MVNLVLIGYGYWGPNIARNSMVSSKVNFLGICDNDEARLQKAKLIYGESINYYSDYKELINRNDIDAFALAVKNDVSQKIAEEILNAGKNLFIEKPIAKSIHNAEKLIKIAKEQKKILHVDHIMIFNPIIRKIKEIIDSGELGELIYFDSSRINLGPSIKKDVNAMWDLAVHDLAVVDYLSNGATVKKVNAIGLNTFGSKEELTYLTVQYESFIAMLKSSWISPVKERKMVIGGTKKMIVFDELNMDQLLVYDKGVNLINHNFNEYGSYEMKIRTGNMYSPQIDEEDSLLNSINHFSDCIEMGQESISNGEHAVRIIHILEKADLDLEDKSNR